MLDPAAFVLIHSPLVGAWTWSLVADGLHTRHIEAFVPALTDSASDPRPYWQQHAQSVARELAFLPADRSLILVGHSGAGPLLPAIRQRLPQPVSAYIFVDAGLPHNGASRLDLLATESPTLANHVHQHLEAGGRFPEWTDEQLRRIIPNPHQRQHLLAELQPRSLPFFTEPIPVWAAWPDAPCAYMQFSPSYAASRRFAQQASWLIRTVDAEHFHMLVEPTIVAALLIEIVQTIAASSSLSA